MLGRMLLTLITILFVAGPGIIEHFTALLNTRVYLLRYLHHNFWVGTIITPSALQIININLMLN